MENQQHYQTRARLRPDSINNADFSVDAVLSTEKPVVVYDRAVGGLLDEVLLSNGAEFSEQLPLLDSHNLNSCSNVLGSVRNIRVEDNKLVGTLFFSQDDGSLDVFKKVAGGHVTDLSIGYSIAADSSISIPPKTSQMVGDTLFTAMERMLVIRTKFKIFEASLTPIGANDETKTRNMEILNMSEKPEPLENESPEIPNTEPDAVLAERTRANGIVLLCRKFNVSPDEYIASGVSEIDVKCAILDKMEQRRVASAPKPSTPHVEHGEDQVDKTRKFIENSLHTRAGLQVPHVDQPAKPLALGDLARIFFRSQGVDTDHMGKVDIASLCFRARPAGSTSDFPYLLGSVLNNRMLKSYQDFSVTYDKWCVIDEVPDFRDNYITNVDDGADLELTPENTDFKEDSYTEAQETYKLGTYGKIFSISQQAIIDDRFGFFNKIAIKQGRMAKRKENVLAYAVLTANAAMADGVALFHATHSNLAGTPADLSHDSFGLAKSQMRLQKDLSGTYSLNIIPKFLLVTAEDEALALQIAESQYIPSASNVMTENLHRGTITPIVEPLLSDNDADTWYLTADPNMYETVVVAFLQGMRNPILEMQDSFDSWGRKYRVIHNCAAKAADFRGLYKVEGA